MTVGFRSLQALYFVLQNLGIMNFFVFFYAYFFIGLNSIKLAGIIQFTSFNIHD